LLLYGLRKLEIMNLNSGKIQTLVEENDLINWATISPDGKRVVWRKPNEWMCLLDLSSREVVGGLRPHRVQQWGIAEIFTHQGEIIGVDRAEDRMAVRTYGPPAFSK